MMDLPPSDDLAIEKICTAASPIAHVTSSAPPVLLNRGDANTTAPTSGLQRWRRPFAAKVPVTLVRIPGAELGSDFGAVGKPHPECAYCLGETIHWLDHELKAAPASAAKYNEFALD